MMGLKLLYLPGKRGEDEVNIRCWRAKTRFSPTQVYLPYRCLFFQEPYYRQYYHRFKFHDRFSLMVEKGIKEISKITEISARRVEAVIKLLDEGCTVPFIARYRKEATG